MAAFGRCTYLQGHGGAAKKTRCTEVGVFPTGRCRDCETKHEKAKFDRAKRAEKKEVIDGLNAKIKHLEAILECYKEQCLSLAIYATNVTEKMSRKRTGDDLEPEAKKPRDEHEARATVYLEEHAEDIADGIKKIDPKNVFEAVLGDGTTTWLEPRRIEIIDGKVKEAIVLVVIPDAEYKEGFKKKASDDRRLEPIYFTYDPATELFLVVDKPDADARRVIKTTGSHNGKPPRIVMGPGVRVPSSMVSLMPPVRGCAPWSRYLRGIPRQGPLGVEEAEDGDDQGEPSPRGLARRSQPAKKHASLPRQPRHARDVRGRVGGEGAKRTHPPPARAIPAAFAQVMTLPTLNHRVCCNAPRPITIRAPTRHWTIEL